MSIETINKDGGHYRSSLNRLARLFDRMDRAYAKVAGQYGFHCQGCRDNCCETRFYHHTLLEYLYLAQGIKRLDPAIWKTVFGRALSVNAQWDAADRRGEPLRVMCPLNKDGRCLAYAHRPMICRLHGIPHELHRPGGGPFKTPGCDAFFNQCRQRGKNDYIPFDRTPFYRDMAILEKELRSTTGYHGKIKLTIAQMLATLTDPDNEIS